MNYIKQIKFFWARHTRHGLGAGEVALYFYLLEAANRDGAGKTWSNPVIEANDVLKRVMGVKNHRTLENARKRLRDAGVLDYRTKNGSQLCEYGLCDAETNKLPELTFVVTCALNAKVNDANSTTTIVLNTKDTTEVAESFVEPLALNTKVPAKVNTKVGETDLLYNINLNLNKANTTPAQVANSSDVLILKPDEIVKQLSENEYEVRRFVCTTYELGTEDDFALYRWMVATFVGDKSAGVNELDKSFSDVIKHFKNWVGTKATRLKKQWYDANKNNRQEAGTNARGGHGKIILATRG